MKRMISLMTLFFIGLILLQGCTKETSIYVPISFTDKEGYIFIKIDTITKNIDAYSKTKVSTGLLKGIFNDTVRSCFYLGIITDPYWDTVYHERDTIVFPTRYSSHIKSFETPIDLKNFNSPYHFILLGMPVFPLKKGPHGSPSIVFTVDTRTDGDSDNN
jgi:hypothetical protein